MLDHSWPSERLQWNRDSADLLLPINFHLVPFVVFHLAIPQCTPSYFFAGLAQVLALLPFYDSLPVLGFSFPRARFVVFVFCAFVLACVLVSLPS